MDFTPGYFCVKSRLDELMSFVYGCSTLERALRQILFREVHELSFLSV